MSSSCPDLRPHFRHVIWRPMPHSHGVPVGSDWSDKTLDDPTFGLYRNCGLWTMDEVAILYDVASQVQGHWVDVGAHTGWTTAYLLAAGCAVESIDPMFVLAEFRHRFWANLSGCGTPFLQVRLHPNTSSEFFHEFEKPISGCIIDGDHTAPIPLRDAQLAAGLIGDRGAVLLHDAVGGPVHEAVHWLVDQGFHKRVYATCHGVALCWRGDLTPPSPTPIPRVAAAVCQYLEPIWAGQA